MRTGEGRRPRCARRCHARRHAASSKHQGGLVVGPTSGSPCSRTRAEELWKPPAPLVVVTSARSTGSAGTRQRSSAHGGGGLYPLRRRPEQASSRASSASSSSVNGAPHRIRRAWIRLDMSCRPRDPSPLGGEHTARAATADSTGGFVRQRLPGVDDWMCISDWLWRWRHESCAFYSAWEPSDVGHEAPWDRQMRST